MSQQEMTCFTGDPRGLQGILRIDGTPSLPALPRKRVKLSHDDGDYTPELRALSANASDLEVAYHTHLVKTLAKWSAKIQAVAPSVLLPANRTSFKKSMGSKTDAPDVVEVIDSVLQSDAQKLLARTRSLRQVVSEDQLEDGAHARSPDAFDDTDFYQQLLRDVIESRGPGGTEEAGEQEWIRRQKALKMKRRKSLDTRASKGRKLRYQVHEKLQSFMVPISTSYGAWHEEQVDELFTSLLGARVHHS